MNTQTIPSKLNANTSEHFEPEVLSPAWYRDPVALRMLVATMEAEERAQGRAPVRSAFAVQELKYHWDRAQRCSNVGNARLRARHVDRILSDTRLIQMQATAPHRVCMACWSSLVAKDVAQFVPVERPKGKRSSAKETAYVKPKKWTPEERKALQQLNGSVGGRGYHRGARGMIYDGSGSEP